MSARAIQVWPSHVWLAQAIALGLLVTAPGARADGDDFFRSEVFKADGTRLKHSGYYGSVKDDRGKHIYDATITVSVTVTTEQGSQQVVFNAYTDLLGRYRTLDVAGVVFDLTAIETEIDPKTVEVTVAKKGYVTVRRLNRAKPGQAGAIEIDFVMAKML